MIEIILIILIIISMLILTGIIYTRIIKDKLPKKGYKFNIGNLPKKKKAIKKAVKVISSIKQGIPIKPVNVMYISDNSTIFLGGGEKKTVENQDVISFNIGGNDKEMQYNPTNICKVYHSDFEYEDILVFGENVPANVRLSSSIDLSNKNLMASKARYDNASLRLGQGILHSTILSADGNILRLMLFIMIGGIGIGIMIGLYVGIRFI